MAAAGLLVGLAAGQASRRRRLRARVKSCALPIDLPRRALLLVLLLWCRIVPLQAAATRLRLPATSTIPVARASAALSSQTGPHSTRPRVRMAAMLAPDDALDVDAGLFAIALAGAAYASGYATEGYEPHKL